MAILERRPQWVKAPKPKRVTPRQRRAAELVLENEQAAKPRPMGVILREAGYAPSKAEEPHTITESPGYKQAMRDLGLTEELISSAIVEDIKAKPANRVSELRLGADVLGMVKREPEAPKGNTNTTYNFIFSQQVQDKVRTIDAEIKELLTNGQGDDPKET